MQLYSYFRSSASYRVRIALGLKGLKVEILPVNLLKEAQKSPEYARINPQALVPALVEESGAVLTQSLAIIEYLDETRPEPPLLPQTPLERARVRALSLAIACEIAPLNNSGVMRFLEHEFKQDSDARQRWYAHWVAKGFRAVETMLQQPQTGMFCHGDAPSMADCCLIPQVYNARRFACDLAPYPTIRRIAQACEALPAFQAAHPDTQPDTV